MDMHGGEEEGRRREGGDRTRREKGTYVKGKERGLGKGRKTGHEDRGADKARVQSKAWVQTGERGGGERTGQRRGWEGQAYNDKRALWRSEAGEGCQVLPRVFTTLTHDANTS